MDQMMMQILAQQLGISPETAANMQPNDIAASLASRTSDPIIRAMLYKLATQEQQKNSIPTADADDKSQDIERELIRMKREVAQLRQQLASADIMARYIADLLGACSTCWGLNRICVQCGGKGKPGYTQPDIEELTNWMEPAFKKGGLNLIPMRLQSTVE